MASSSIKFTFDQDTKKLTIDDDGVKRTWFLTDGKSTIFYYILKAIDLLDDQSGGDANVAEWAKKDNTDYIPESKINLETLEKDLTINPTNVFEGATESETSDEDAIKYTFSGGSAV